MQKHGAHECRVLFAVVADDGSALVHNDRDETWTEVERSVHAQHRPHLAVAGPAAESFHVDYLLVGVQYDVRCLAFHHDDLLDKRMRVQKADDTQDIISNVGSGGLCRGGGLTFLSSIANLHVHTEHKNNRHSRK